MHRFFVPPETLAQSPIVLTGELAHQLGRVLRLRPGDEIVLLDGAGAACRARLERLTALQVIATPLEYWRPNTEPRVEITLYQALPKAKRWDWVLQKATELGVSAIVPLLTRHVVAHPGERDEHKLTRWRQIVREAAEQSGRARLPEVWPVTPWEAACLPPPPGTLSLIAALSPTAGPLSVILGELASPPAAVRLYIGPEGDFAPDELALAQEVGIQPITLGPRVLRTETAPIVALSALLYALGELDRPATL
jgi:16S rRNA (uracil1498-N3)-methyltransferase